jgi:hypothetical protein
MAGKQAFVVANVADPKWILSESTGRLGYENLKYVSRNPAQTLLVEHASETVTQEFADRYRRIMQDKRDRGVS